MFIRDFDSKYYWQGPNLFSKNTRKPTGTIHAGGSLSVLYVARVKDRALLGAATQKHIKLGKMSYSMHIGPVIPGSYVHHMDRNKSNLSPDNLELRWLRNHQTLGPNDIINAPITPKEVSMYLASIAP